MKLSDLLAFLEDASQFKVLYRGTEVAYLDECGSVGENSHFYVAGNDPYGGASVLVHVESYRGNGFDDAWAAWVDSMPAIPTEELVEAYQTPTEIGRESKTYYELACEEIEAPAVNYPWNEYREKRLARATELFEATVKNGDYPEIVEGYEMDSSGNVKHVSDYAWMNAADLDDIEIVRRDSAAEDAAE